MATPPDDSRGDGLRSIGALSAVGLTLVFAIMLGAVGGYFVDEWLGSGPWGLLIGFFLGMAAGMRSLFQTVSAVSKDERHDG